MGTLKIVCAVFFISLFLDCANPVDKDPLKWRSATEVPLTNEKINLGKELPGILADSSNMQFLGVDSNFYNDPKYLVKDTVDGDTIAFSTPSEDSSEFETHQDTIGEKLFHAAFGPVQISGAPIIQNTIPLPQGVEAFNVPIPITLDSVYHIRFCDTTKPLQIKISNPSSISIRNISINIDGVGSDDVGDIDAGSSTIASIPIDGKSIDHTLLVTLTGSALEAPGELALEFSLNGLSADSAVVDDHLITFHKEFINSYELTDTVAIDYIDIADGFFQYSLDNQTGIELRVKEDHLNLWMISGVANTVTKLSDLANFADSTDSAKYYSGLIVGGETGGGVIEAHSGQIFEKKNISENRLFTEWDPAREKTITKVRYEINNAPHHGDTISISANDSLNFSVKPISFKFREFVGTAMETYVRQSDTQNIAVELPFGKEANDSLRGKLILQSVKGDVHIDPKLPQGAFIDTMLINFMAFPSDSVQIKDSTIEKFVHLETDTSYIRSIDFTRVTNCFPDTISIVSTIRVPKGTRMKIVNDLSTDDPKYNDYMGRMRVRINTFYRLDGNFAWEILAPVVIDLGTNKFKIPEELNYFRKMVEKTTRFTLNIRNNSNLNMYLYSLIAPDRMIDTLNLLSDNEVTRLISESGEAENRGFVNFLGSKGVRIPPRDSSVRDTVVLKEEQLDSFLYSDSCAWRWQLRFLPQDRDALKDTDFIEIHSRMRIDGTNNTDSLLIW